MLTDVLDREISLRLWKCKGGIKGGRTMSISKVKKSKDARMAGVLMPVASLPSKDGVGNFGKEAYAFVDKLADMGIRIWQILPLNPLGYGNSPYQPFSSYAGDELYIDLDLLAEKRAINACSSAIFSSARLFCCLIIRWISWLDSYQNS